MEKIIISCDKCSAVVEERKDLRRVLIGVGDVDEKGTRKNSSYFTPKIELDLCAACLKKIGIVKETLDEEGKIVEKVADVKNRLFEIVEEIAVNVAEDYQS